MDRDEARLRAVLDANFEKLNEAFIDFCRSSDFEEIITRDDIDDHASTGLRIAEAWESYQEQL